MLIVRWALVPVLAIVSYLIVAFFALLIDELRFYLSPIDDAGLFVKALVVVTELVGAMSAVVVGASVAPNNKLRVATILCLLNLFLWIPWLFIDTRPNNEAFENSFLLDLVQSMFAISGGIAGWYIVYKRRAATFLLWSALAIWLVGVLGLILIPVTTFLWVLVAIFRVNAFLLILGIPFFPITFLFAVPIVWITSGSFPWLFLLLWVSCFFVPLAIKGIIPGGDFFPDWIEERNKESRF